MHNGAISDAQAQRFKQLAWPLMPMVLRTAQYLTRHNQQGEDLAQATMIKAMRAIDTYQDDTNLKAWLLTILRRTHIDQLRAQRNKPAQVSVSSEVLELAADNPQDSTGQFDEQWTEPEALMSRFEDDAVIQAMGELPEDIRWTLLLVDVEQLEHAEVAIILNVALGTIKSRTHRGRSMLRDRLHQLAVQRGWVSTRESLA
ncbi:sigma-70 family RNA polymerase sigma factor [bacterium AH-315-I18]|nr:sigma-70 family RNA polymerase sigma factor [Phycisphaeraceae bacterium]MBN4061236.1 sigma-70 family RNA polymerase sigma factor [bacterium AH-315-I18]